MLRRFITTVAITAALAMTMPAGGAFAAGHGGSGGHGGHGGVGGHGGPGGVGGHGGPGGHFVGGGGHFVGGRGFHHGYAPGYYYGGGYYPPDYGYYEEPDYAAAEALGIISMITGIIGSHFYHRHCWLHHGRRYC